MDSNEVLNGPGTTAYSPAYSPINESPLLPEYSHTTGDPANSGNLMGNPKGYFELMPPDPAVGGQPTQANQLGYSTGIRPYRSLAQPLTGAVLVIPALGANKPGGPVGYSTRSQRLANGIQALSTDYLPSQEAIAQSFISPGLTKAQRELMGLN